MRVSLQVLCDFSVFDGDTGMWVESVPTPHFLCCHSAVALPQAPPAPPSHPPSPSPLGKPRSHCIFIRAGKRYLYE